MKYIKDWFLGLNSSPAQITDRIMQRTALGLLLLSISYGLSAGIYLMSYEPELAIISNAQRVLSLLIILLVLPVFIQFTWLRYRKKDQCEEMTGFISEMYKNACSLTFGLTFMLLVTLEVISEKYYPELPPAFFINLILSFASGLFSILFFRSTNTKDSDDDFDMESDA